MSKILDMAVAIDEEFDKLRYEIESINCYANQIEEVLQKEKAKNREIASILRMMANRIEQE